jgi:hypothetical protein
MYLEGFIKLEMVRSDDDDKDVHIYTFTAIAVVIVVLEGTEFKFRALTYTCQALIKNHDRISYSLQLAV